MTATAVRRYRGTSLDERRAERRTALIDAAIRVYGDVGYRAASVKAVCEAAGLTERYFYESFANSDALLAAAYVRVTTNLRDAMAEAAAAGGVRAALEIYYSRLREHPQGARVFLVEIAGVSPAVDAAVAEALAAWADLLAPGGDRTPGSAASLVAAGMAGGVIHIALAWIASGYACPIGEVVDAAMRICRVAI